MNFTATAQLQNVTYNYQLKHSGISQVTGPCYWLSATTHRYYPATISACVTVIYKDTVISPGHCCVCSLIIASTVVWSSRLLVTTWNRNNRYRFNWTHTYRITRHYHVGLSVLACSKQITILQCCNAVQSGSASVNKFTVITEWPQGCQPMRSAAVTLQDCMDDTIYNRLQPILEAPPTCWNRPYS